MKRLTIIACILSTLLFCSGWIQADEKLPVLPLSPEGQKWIDKQIDVAKKSLEGKDGGLVDASTFLSDDIRAQLTPLANVKDTHGKYTVTLRKLAKSEHGYDYAFDVVHKNGAKNVWYIGGAAWYKDQFPKGLPLSMHHTVLWKQGKCGKPDKLIQGCGRTENVFDFTKKTISADAVLTICKKAEESRSSEQKDAAGMQTFDLPRDRSIAYIGIADANPRNEPIIASITDDVRYWPEMLALCGYKIVADDTSRYVRAHEHPYNIVSHAVVAWKKKGVRDFYVRLCGHGNSGGIYFSWHTKKKEFRYACFSPEDHRRLLNAHPDCNFFIKSIACSGGGLAKEMESYRDPADKNGRVYVFLETKRHGYAQEGRLQGVEGQNGAPKPYSTYSTPFFVKKLVKGKGKVSYGQAYLYSDQESKKRISADIEVWKSGKGGGILTGHLLREDIPQISLAMLHSAH